MVSEIRVYVEGGGNNSTSRRRMRSGFGGFLRPLRDLARERRLGWQVVVCGPRTEAFASFKLGMKTHPAAFNVLLVDSEAPATDPVWDHVRRHDGWPRPADTLDSQCHLMVQAVEAWIIADPGTLAGFYGQGFLGSAIPRSEDVESIGKDRLLPALERATRETKKGKYHKIDHCAALLEMMVPSRVRARARHCDRLFRELESVIRRSA